MRKFMISVNGQQYEVEVEEVKNAKNARPSASIATPAQASPEKAAPVSVNNTQQGSSKIKSPMPGSILRVNVNDGDTVKHGQPLLILEAMKMENEITAPADGKIAVIKVNKGDCVTMGQTLIEMV